MLNYDELNRKFPTVAELEPDYELIKFGYTSIMSNNYIANMNMYIGMLKYILSRNPQEFEKEYKLLYEMYYKVYLS